MRRTSLTANEFVRIFALEFIECCMIDPGDPDHGGYCFHQQARAILGLDPRLPHPEDTRDVRPQ